MCEETSSSSYRCVWGDFFFFVHMCVRSLLPGKKRETKVLPNRVRQRSGIVWFYGLGQRCCSNRLPSRSPTMLRTIWQYKPILDPKDPFDPESLSKFFLSLERHSM
jgi:hypothetical protein